MPAPVRAPLAMAAFSSCSTAGATGLSPINGVCEMPRKARSITPTPTPRAPVWSRSDSQRPLRARARACSRIGHAAVLTPCHDAIRPHQQGTCFLDFAHRMPAAVRRPARPGRRSRRFSGTARSISFAASTQARPAMPVTSENLPLPTRSSVDTRRPSGPTSQAWGSLAPGPGRGLHMKLRVALPDLLGRVGIRDDGVGHAALVELDALGVELVVLQLQRLGQRSAPGDALGPGIGSFSRPAATGSGASVSRKVWLSGRIVQPRLVGPLHDLRAHRRALQRVGVQQSLAGVTLDDERQLPCQVEGVLHAGVRAQAAGGRMAVHGIAAAEDATLDDRSAHAPG